MNNLQLETFCGEFRLKRYAPFISDFYDSRYFTYVGEIYILRNEKSLHIHI